MLRPINERGSRVLVVDDERYIAGLISRQLRRNGYEVTCVYDGRQAIEALEKQTFDQAVLDLVMPEVDGYEVLKWIRTHSKSESMYVTVMTDQVEAIFHDPYLTYRADAYFAKRRN